MALGTQSNTWRFLEVIPLPLTKPKDTMKNQNQKQQEIASARHLGKKISLPFDSVPTVEGPVPFSLGWFSRELSSLAISSSKLSLDQGHLWQEQKCRFLQLTTLYACIPSSSIALNMMLYSHWSFYNLNMQILLEFGYLSIPWWYIEKQWMRLICKFLLRNPWKLHETRKILVMD